MGFPLSPAKKWENVAVFLQLFLSKTLCCLKCIHLHLLFYFNSNVTFLCWDPTMSCQTTISLKLRLWREKKLHSRASIFDHKLAQPWLNLSNHLILMIHICFIKVTYLLAILFTYIYSKGIKQKQWGNTKSNKNMFSQVFNSRHILNKNKVWTN